MSEEFFVLEYAADKGDGYCTVDDLVGFEDMWVVAQGVSLAANPPKHLAMSMSADRPRHSVLADYVKNTDSLMIVSPRLRSFLEAQKVDDVEYYGLEIKDQKGKLASDRYFVAHLVNPVDCIDVEQSGVTWTGEGSSTQRILFLDRLALDSARVPKGRKLFFPRYYSEIPVVRRELAEAMKREGFTNVDIVPISEHAC
ncbi:MAG TPA: DUF1629 domain-containing protein [Polyangiaceae bacterium]|jgi:hypothetical protein